MSPTGKKVFESRAKLMLSGEYSVLKGALSLALPLKYGQTLTIEAGKGEMGIAWKSMVGDRLWFSSTINLPDMKVMYSTDPVISATLGEILSIAKKLNPYFLKESLNYQVTSSMDFDPAWGIGSSSSLISNIAYWAECDPFELNRQVFNGSGYDIACARSESPILFEIKAAKPIARKANFYPSFHTQLYFVYLNRKQNSKESIRDLDLDRITTGDIDAISALTLGIGNADNLEIFQSMIDQHEKLIGKMINQTPVKQLYFRDFKGSVKSLGAWGGDFILVASSAPEVYIRDYFACRNFNSIFKYAEMVVEKQPTKGSTTTA